MTWNTKETNTHTVFVYGTLRAGGSNAFRMKGASFIGPGRATGSLYRVDWYPGAIFARDVVTEIMGELYEVSTGHLQELDAFEGEEYRRVNILVTTEQGEVFATVWEYRRPTETLEQLMSGDWLEEYRP